MLCSKCYKKLPRGEEIQIEGSIICQKCALNSLEKREIIGRCNRCSKLIYKDETVHEVYENWGSENSEKLVKCRSCYKEWLETVKLKKKNWELMRWFEISLPFNTWLVLFMITLNKNKEHVGWGPLLLTFSLVINIFLLSPAFSLVIKKVFEWKYRREKNKLKQKIKKLIKKMQEKVILKVELYWKVNQNKSGKINGKTIIEALGKSWKSDLNDKKETENISTERNRLIKKNWWWT